MADQPTSPIPALAAAPAKPQAAPRPPKPAKLKRPSKVAMLPLNATGTTADVSAAIAGSKASDAHKAMLQAELTASGAKAATLDFHRHEMTGPNGKMIVIHATIKPLF